ncbi:TauD/TfdA family dioxygenase [Novosphingobium sp. AP12]|uniref:TauD/TfdA dioxygenase family protein n=1 Tax=Novosphingobium sp. AP12 TaxID=1144305 RepID=UPI000271EC09|nr:TauD/TfdA family dioxygenase [Novosphingobium sp. AP12]EJL34397.1 putative taurine catabolism dioxygenase [Novosphingobium sp. AP12]
MPIGFRPINENIGAYVDVAADNVLNHGTPEKIMAALDRYNVLVFPQVNMSDETFLDLTAALGEKHDTKVTDDGTSASQKGIFRIALDKDDRTQREFILGNDYWHMDGMSYTVPVKATMLKCESAPAEGGDTGFANLHAAYAALPAQKKAQIDGLRVGHALSASLSRLYEAPSAEDYARWDAIFPRLEHPLVWKQKEGKAALLIGSTAHDVAGLEPEESRALLDELLEWSTQASFTYRHKWASGDLVIFNNPGLLHRSYPYDDGAGRVMHRTTLKGEEAIASDARRPARALY